MTEENEAPATSEKNDASPGQEATPHGGGRMLVAIGASAGGVEALQKLFGAMPVETGLTFAVILHTTGEPESHLAEIIQRKTQIPVVAVKSSATLRINHIYCLPSDKEIELLEGEVLVTDRTLSEDRRAPIDLFLRSVAGTYKERAISIILSGAGSDGSLGTGRVREEGGVNIVQDPSEAEYALMPRSAIEHGSVDFILPLEQIPAKLVSWNIFNCLPRKGRWRVLKARSLKFLLYCAPARATTLSITSVPPFCGALNGECRSRNAKILPPT